MEQRWSLNRFGTWPFDLLLDVDLGHVWVRQDCGGIRLLPGSDVLLQECCGTLLPFHVGVILPEKLQLGQFIRYLTPHPSTLRVCQVTSHQENP